MSHIKIILLNLQLCLMGFNSFSQTTYLTEKLGKYVYRNNLEWKGTDYITFGKNAKIVADYFQQSIPLMKANKGFDLDVILFGVGTDDYLNKKWNYGLRGELVFRFQLFLKDAAGKEGKWTIEPPNWRLFVNNTETGHGGMLNQGNEGSFLKELFLVFPLVKEIAPGVHYFGRACNSLVVFNPDRPDYWLPVTVREVVDAKLKYYLETDKFIYDFIKPLTDKMSEAELNAPAFNESDDGILNVNGKGQGLQIMRFNPEYWDRSLHPSTIQFLSLNYAEYDSEFEQKIAEEEYLKNNGRINYSKEVMKSLTFKELIKLVQKK